MIETIAWLLDLPAWNYRKENLGFIYREGRVHETTTEVLRDTYLKITFKTTITNLWMNMTDSTQHVKTNIRCWWI